MRAWLAGIVLAMAFVSTPASAWWNKDWSYRKAITIDASQASLDAPVSNFPVLVRLDTSGFDFDDAKADGSDLRFLAGDDKTELPFTIERFDAKTGLAAIWVAMPTLAGQQKIWMYFGNKKAAPEASNGPQSADVFDPVYAGLYHFDKSLDDASSHRNALTGSVGFNDASWIGQGASFDGKSLLTAPQAIVADPTQGFSFEAWIKPRDANASVLYATHNGANGLVIGLDKGAPYVEITANGQATRTTPIPALSGWSYVAVTADAHGATLFVNGTSEATLTTPLPQLAGGTVGGDQTPSYAGDMDELRVSTTARPAAYIKASYAAEREGAKLVALGPTEEPAETGFGYFGIIFANVTLDAWVVIAILGVMGVMSWIVMWSKGAYVGRTARANAAFTTYFNRLKGDILNLENGLSRRDLKLLESSSLYRIYKLGVSEIKARQEEQGGSFHLSEESLEAVKASLDAGQIEEVQALDRGIVLLTISIAGAPFIGLLGTVLGVMITFAAIAASGEVNVNAIAPGIAAALLATVAGLAVAIPALFGYNYIASRNSDVAAKTQIFGDRLITRFAELEQRRRNLRAAE